MHPVILKFRFFKAHHTVWVVGFRDSVHGFSFCCVPKNETGKMKPGQVVERSIVYLFDGAAGIRNPNNSLVLGGSCTVLVRLQSMGCSGDNSSNS